MTPAFSARRRADEFEALVSRPDGPPDDRSADRYGDLLTLVGDLRAVPGPTPRADFVASLRERLMVEADTVLLPMPRASDAHQKLALPVRTRRDRRFATVLGSAALVGATATVAVAAQTALPGESLYPVKQAMEAAEHRLASDDASRGRALMASAEHRLTELEALAAEDPTGADSLIPDTLDRFSQQSEDAGETLLDAYAATGDRALVEQLREFTAESMDRLTRVESSLPSSARDELLAAGRGLADLDASASAVCPVCDGGIGEVPEFLLQPVAARDLIAGLDRDRVQLDPTPISGQDVEGIIVPDVLRVPGTGGGTGDPGDGSTEGPGSGVGEGTVDGNVDGNVDVPPGTTDPVTGTAGEVTGGAVGGLTEGVEDATGGLIDDVTGTLGQLPDTGVSLP